MGYRDLEAKSDSIRRRPSPRQGARTGDGEEWVRLGWVADTVLGTWGHHVVSSLDGLLE